MDQSITTSFKPFFAEALGIMSIDKIIDWGLENNNKYSISFFRLSTRHGHRLMKGFLQGQISQNAMRNANGCYFRLKIYFIFSFSNLFLSFSLHFFFHRVMKRLRPYIVHSSEFAIQVLTEN